jgi:V8-like Glu-specific endopeptidase
MTYDRLRENAPQNGTAQPSRTKTSCTKKILIGIFIVIILLVIIALAVGLGVGLGARYSNKINNLIYGNSNSSNLTDTSTAANANSLNQPDTSSNTNASSSGETAINITPIVPTNIMTAPAPAGKFSILEAPTVNCTYNMYQCGCSSTQPLFAAQRIFQGYSATANSWPWMVKLTITINSDEYGCGGFLISFRHIVTAAHCMMLPGTTPNAITVRAGIQNLSEEDTGQTLSVATITVHPDFNTDTLENDIAILTLATPVNPSSTTGLCCVSYNTSLPTIGQHAVVIGWGYTKEEGTSSDDLLQAVTKIQAPSSICNITSPDSQFCAGYNGTDVCQGDSGGPLMIVVNNAWTCAGIVSYGPSCHEQTAFSRIAAFKDFIFDNVYKLA